MRQSFGDFEIEIGKGRTYVQVGRWDVDERLIALVWWLFLIAVLVGVFAYAWFVA